MQKFSHLPQPNVLNNTCLKTVKAIFVGTDQHIHVLVSSGWSLEQQRRQFFRHDPKQRCSCGLDATLELDLGNDNSETFFVGTDAHVHRVLKTNGAWENDDISALAGSPTNTTPMLASPLQAYALLNGAAAIFFTGTDQHAHGLYYSGNGSWANNDISAIAGAPTNVLPALP